MYTNRLADEKSPYLLQHAHNPVDWYPWGEAAFDRARREDKPIFLSIGYSTCHWCHVMERESFESEEVAEVLNRGFVSIKVDREERPDVDRIYMAFVQATTQSGGWPMSVWLTPDLKPFYGGTYFPPDNRYGRPGFAALLEYIAQAWKQDRAKILESSDNILAELKRVSEVRGSSQPAVVDAGSLDSCFQVFRRTYDPAMGGFGNAPKFPRPVAYNFLLSHHASTGNQEALDMVLHTLREMYKGGMYDQVGGGFHRYSVDERWFVPHFEKMLYDQGQLAVSYLQAYQITGDKLFADVARDVFEYVLRDMTHPEGGFYSAEDADSVIDKADPHEKGEGAFYVWTRTELDEVLGADAEWFSRAYGVQENGNVFQDSHGEFRGKNILWQAHAPAADAIALAAAKRKLLDTRSARRVRPHLDDKVLAGWNGMMISAFALGARVLNDTRYEAAGRRAADFVLAKMTTADGGLMRRYRDGDAAIPGFLDDYALFASGLVELYESTFDGRYLAKAIGLAERMIRQFKDREGGFFSTTGDDASLVMRMKEDYDGAEPSGNSTAATLLFRLAAMTGREDFREAAARTIAVFAPRLRVAPHATPQMMVAFQFAQSAPKQLVLAGEPGAADFAALARVAWNRFDPRLVTMRADATLLPATAPMVAVDGRPTAYLCENFTCKLPVQESARLSELLN